LGHTQLKCWILAFAAGAIRLVGMRSRFLASLCAAAFLVAYAAPAVAEKGSWLEPPKKLPSVAHGDRSHNLDFLFGALKLAPDDVTAKAIEERIWALWVVSRSDTTNLLMTHKRCAPCWWRRGAERHAGDDDHALARLAKPSLKAMRPARSDHVVEVLRVFGDHAMHAPHHRQARPVVRLGVIATTGGFGPLARHPHARSIPNWSSR
jgi:hypothetical protein